MDLVKLMKFLRDEWETDNEKIPFKFPVKSITEDELPGYQILYEITGSKKD